MAKPRLIPGIEPEMRYSDAAARIVGVRAGDLAAQSHDVLETDDIERVHDMRVASRRLRAALEIFGPCFSREEVEAVLGEVKELADALGERRDRDVTIGFLENFAANVPAADRPGIASLVAQVRAEQEEANEALVPYVESERLDALQGRLAKLVAEVST